ncbi:hypothetical protein [Planococcus sp. YIM B11945]|uniref:hypothetical protein n=1 Tax=Planococcus sp. YIM B11945 TaxID=3435410 RepID=UPI003D7C79D9
MDVSWGLIIGGGLLVMASLVYSSLNERLRAMEARIQTLNEKINRLSVPDNERDREIIEELRRLKNGGQAIKAVKEARKAFGFTLLEAKQYVDNL